MTTNYKSLKKSKINVTSKDHTYKSLEEILYLKAIKILTPNIRSLTPKYEQVSCVLEQYKIDFLCITETWLSNKTHTTRLNLQIIMYIDLTDLKRKDEEVYVFMQAIYITVG